MRPCTCDRVDVGHAYDPDAHCRSCWLYHHNPGSNREWGGDGLVALVDGVAHVPTPRVHGVHPAAPATPTPPAPPLRPCAHLRGETGELVRCGTCAGAVRLKVLGCAVHGKCTVGKPLPGVACCETCTDNTGRPITLNLGAGGLGDALLASCAVLGLAKREPGRAVRYKINPSWIPFLSLWDAGYHDLAAHDWDNCADLPAGAQPGDVQLNVGYGNECRTRCAVPRVERWCRNVGGVTPARPSLRDPAAVAGACPRDYAGVVALAPFSTWHSREWPLHHWQTLERMLLEHGYRTLVLDARDARFPDRHLKLRGEKLIDAPALTVTGVLLRAACLVGGDSGLAHLGGMLGTKTLVVMGQVRHGDVYAWYGPHVEALEGHLDCRGCYWQPPYHSTLCEPVCPNLASNTPEEAFAAVLRMAGEPTSARVSSLHDCGGETAKAHARRLREGWYAEHVKAPALDLGCGRDPLFTGFPVRRWDPILGDGDAQRLEGVPADTYATVYASHLLEHVHDPVAALRRWYEVLAPGGKLIVCVPDVELYEGRLELPSRWNADHKHYWRLSSRNVGDPPHVRGLEDTIAEAIPDGETVSLRVLDEGRERNGDNHPTGEFSLEIIVRKPL